MSSPPPRPVPEPTLPSATGAGALRGTVYALLGLLLLAGAWVRFNPQIAALAPGLAAPVANIAAQVAEPGRARGLLEVDLVPLSDTAQAVAAMGLPAGQEAALIQAVRDRRLRLVQLPLFDFAPPADGMAEDAPLIEIGAGGYTRVVALSRLPVAVTLPIAQAGTVSLRNVGTGTAAIGAVTLTGPVRLPDLAGGGGLEVGVIAQ